jgi:hypothetical protein
VNLRIVVTGEAQVVLIRMGILHSTAIEFARRSRRTSPSYDIVDPCGVSTEHPQMGRRLVDLPKRGGAASDDSQIGQVSVIKEVEVLGKSPKEVAELRFNIVSRHGQGGIRR